MQEKVAADATSAAATETTTETDGKKAKKVKKSKTDDEPEMSLIEIGPRFVMNLIRIFDGSFGGSTLFENPSFVSPNTSRRLLKMEKMSVYKARLESAGQRDEKGIANVLPADPLADVFK